MASGWRPGRCSPLCTNHLTPCPRCRQTRHEALGGVWSQGLCLPHGRQVPILSRVITTPLPAGQVPAHAAPHLGMERYVPAGMPPATRTSATTRVSGCHPAPTAGSDPAGGTPGTWGTGGAEWPWTGGTQQAPGHGRRSRAGTHLYLSWWMPKPMQVGTASRGTEFNFFHLLTEGRVRAQYWCPGGPGLDKGAGREKEDAYPGAWKEELALC